MKKDPTSSASGPLYPLDNSLSALGQFFSADISLGPLIGPDEGISPSAYLGVSSLMIF
jgi:hypothetical protein